MGSSRNRSAGRTAAGLILISSVVTTAALGQDSAADSVQLPPPDEKDVYNQFAKEVLKSEGTGNADAIHPLAAKYPNDNVIVCQAGCEPGGQIVYKERKSKERVAETAEMIPTASRSAAASNTLSCVAGCYTTPKAYKSVEKRNDLILPAPPQVIAEAKPVPVATEPSSWEASVVHAEEQAASGEAKPATSATAPDPSPAKPAVVAGVEAPAAQPAAPKVEPKIAAPAAPSASPEQIPATKPAPAPVAAAKPAEVPAAAAAPIAPPAKPQAIAKADVMPAPAAAKPAAAPISVASNDAEMNAAIAKARASLDTFWAAMKSPASGETGFSLKVAITEDGETEHFWVSRIERDGDVIRGIINNKPSLVKGIRSGQPYQFTADRISDWLFMRNGKMVGNETMRPLLARMPVKQAEAYRALLETP